MARYRYTGLPAAAVPNARALVTGPGRLYDSNDRPTQSVMFDNAGNLDFWVDTLGTYTAAWDGGSASLQVTGTPGPVLAPAAVGDEWLLSLTGMTASSSPVHVPSTVVTGATGSSVTTALAQSSDYRDSVARVNAEGLYVVTGYLRGTSIAATLGVGSDYTLQQIPEVVTTTRLEVGDEITLRLLQVSSDSSVFLKIERVD